MKPIALEFRKAAAADAQAIVDLVNSGYRGDASRAGWTTEADYLVGLRTDRNEIIRLIDDADTMLLLCLSEGVIVGSVQLQRTAKAAYLGMFVVRPNLQGQGIGRQFLAAAESAIAREWRSAKIQMTVITLRNELIAYYERRGYRRTGIFKPFPVEDTRSSLLVPELRFEVLEKDLA